MKRIAIASLCLACSSALAADLRSVALSVISGRELGAIPPAVCFDPELPNGISGWTGTVAQVEAITGRADVVALATAWANESLAPTEVESVAYTNGWSVRVEDDGSETVWRHRNSPYDPAVDAANLAAVRNSNAVIRAALQSLRANIATNINDSQAISGTTAQQLSALRRELIDSNQTQREIVRLLRAMRREE